jgi:hypothetical protein
VVFSPGGDGIRNPEGLGHENEIRHVYPCSAYELEAARVLGCDCDWPYAPPVRQRWKGVVMKAKLFGAVAVFLITLALPTFCQAAPILYEFTPDAAACCFPLAGDPSKLGGEMISGSFVYDPATSIAYDLNITLTGPIVTGTSDYLSTSYTGIPQIKFDVLGDLVQIYFQDPLSSTPDFIVQSAGVCIIYDYANAVTTTVGVRFRFPATSIITITTTRMIRLPSPAPSPVRDCPVSSSRAVAFSAGGDGGGRGTAQLLSQRILQ